MVVELPDGSMNSSRIVVDPGGDLQISDETHIPADTFARWVAEQESEYTPRWVWSDTSIIYARLLREGVRVERAHDLRLARAILRNNRWTDRSFFSPASESEHSEADSWNSPPPVVSDALFDTSPVVLGDPIAEYCRQMRVLASASAQHRGRLTYLLAAESAGGLIAAEMTHAGVPWDVEIHDSLLAQALGPRPPFGMRPVKLERLAEQIRELLESPHLNPDSPKDLLRALNSAGLDVRSTAKWEIRDLKHPVVPVLLEYKKLHRMMTANGWTWMDEWIRDGRFRPVYVPGGVVTGRWGADGGGALQLPHFVRPAAIADPGWTFVIADAAQLEPRILAAMSGDPAMASAGRGHDMYQGIADAGVVESREHAKYGMLGAMYGGTTGVSAQVLPKFKVAFPRAMALVEGAARAGEQGGTVHTWLGRTSLPGSFDSMVEGDDAQFSQDRRSRARSYGRFTRNFICQGTAAEWALLWMASVRQRLRKITLEAGQLVANPDTTVSITAQDDDGNRPHLDPVTTGPHLVFFLHDEILIHTPQDLAEQVAQAVHDAAREAGRTLFGQIDVEFPVSATISRTYANPKS